MNRWLSLAAGAVLLAVPLLATTDYRMHVANMVGIYVILALGMNLAMGYCGMLNLAIGGLYGVGAYLAALATTQWHLPFPLAVPLAGAAAGALGAVIGLPSLRVRSHYLAMVTMGLGEVLHMIFLNWQKVTRGPEGFAGIPVPTLLGWEVNSEVRWWYVILAVAALMYLLAYRIVHSHVGRAMVAVRDDYIAAAAAGVNVGWYQMVSFALSGLYAGVAGALYAHLVGYISPDSFAFGQTLLVLSMTLVGGLGHLGGSLFGSIFLTVTNEWLRAFEKFQLVFYGALIVVCVVFLPGGVVSLVQRLRALHRPSRAGAPRAAAAGVVAAAGVPSAQGTPEVHGAPRAPGAAGAAGAAGAGPASKEGTVA